MDNNPILLARKIIETTDSNLFLTGKAGTGKTTFLRRLRNDMPKRMVVLAPTGIAAINAEGMTIHSFFQLPFAPYIPGMNYQQDNHYKINKQKLKLVRSLDLLVIDEISMVRADLLDAIDYSLRKIRRSEIPFGGIQLLLIGDLQQLPPVVNDDTWTILRQYYETPYFFSSLALKRTNYITIELEKIYRQTDSRFINLLNKVREGNIDSSSLAEINKRFIPHFKPQSNDGFIQLMTHNDQVNAINESELKKINEDAYHFEATISGKFPESSYPTAEKLTLKRGAQVMFIRNDLNKRFFNGMIGFVQDINEDKLIVCPKNNPNLQINLEPEVWTNVHYGLDKNNNEVKEIIDGTFTQYPVKLAWAITVHKSQGLTFDKVILDVSSSFAHGQTYVALSRCKTLEGIVLKKPIPQTAIIADNYITKFTQDVRLKVINEIEVEKLQQSYTLHLLTDLFSFEKERMLLGTLVRIFEEFLWMDFPATTNSYKEVLNKFDLEIIRVASKFQIQCNRIISENNCDSTSDYLQERLYKASNYFLDKLHSIEDKLNQTNLPIDNAEVSKRMHQTINDILHTIKCHIKLLQYIKDYGFETSLYVKKKTQILLTDMDLKTNKNSSNKHTKNTDIQDPISTDIKNEILYYRLQDWRKSKAQLQDIAPFRVLRNKSLLAISNDLPINKEALLKIPFIGKKSLEDYGSEILKIVNEYVQESSLNKKSLNNKDSSLHQKTKERTQEISLNLYLNGLSPANIAKTRNLKLSTINGHLSQFIETGQVNFFDLVSQKNYNEISSYLRVHPRNDSINLTKIKQNLSDEISFDDIKLTIDKLKW